MSDSQPAVVIFDLDETLTQYDTFLPFITGYVRYHRKRRALGLWRLPLALLKCWRWGSRTWLKTEMLRAFVGGESRQQLQAWSEHFVDHVLNTAMREQGLTQLRAHQQAGARVILASASFDLYVERFAEQLGIAEVLATPMQWDARHRLTGMAGENCRDQEKLRRIKALPNMPADGYGVAAYSDSHADLPMLAWAEHGYAVCPTRELASHMASADLQLRQW